MKVKKQEELEVEQLILISAGSSCFRERRISLVVRKFCLRVVWYCQV